MDSILTIQALTFLVLLAEFLYSLLKKDAVYSLAGTFGNVFRGFILFFISSGVDDFYFDHVFTRNAQSITTHSFITGVWMVFLCLLVLDLLYYLVHWLKHSVGFLWAFHTVHHSDRNFNMSTYLRASWVERILITSLPLLVIFFLGFSTWEITLALSISFIYQFYCHSQYLRLPKFFEWIVITPHLHKIHHDQSEKNQHSNFGVVFSFWDRFFGTYVADIEHFTSGIKGYRQDNFIKMETDPLLGYYRNIL
jgi:sterol desaturase/sphingolipid hydroxylase (fatty acid hydroxylase superfamily)